MAPGPSGEPVQHEELDRVLWIEHDLAVVGQDPTAGDPFDALGGRARHRLLEPEAIGADQLRLAPVEQGLLVAGEAALHHAEHVVVVEVGLRLGRTLAVELLLESHHRVEISCRMEFDRSMFTPALQSGSVRRSASRSTLGSAVSDIRGW